MRFWNWLTVEISFNSFKFNETSCQRPLLRFNPKNIIFEYLQSIGIGNLCNNPFYSRKIWNQTFLHPRYNGKHGHIPISRCHRQTLEGKSNNNCHIVLPNNNQNNRKNKKYWWKRIKYAWRRGSEFIETNCNEAYKNMKHIEIPFSRLFKARYTEFPRVTSAGFRAIAKIHIESDVPVTSFVVDNQGLNAILDGSNTFHHYGGQDDVKIHDFNVSDIFKAWYLVIINYNTDKPADVRYSVKFEEA